MTEYPTEEELKTIREWDMVGIAALDMLRFLDYIKDLWWMPDWGFHLKGKRVLRLELHTGGWSGNEDIIEALQSNFMFWAMYWQQSRRGGHYKFRMELTSG